MENYTKTNIGSEARVELHEKLGLTGAEVSINQLPAGAGVPFVHAHRNNEEIYGIIAGKGKAVIRWEGDRSDRWRLAESCSGSKASVLCCRR